MLKSCVVWLNAGEAIPADQGTVRTLGYPTSNDGLNAAASSDGLARNVILHRHAGEIHDVACSDHAMGHVYRSLW
jgi:hypothetical protein